MTIGTRVATIKNYHLLFKSKKKRCISISFGENLYLYFNDIVHIVLDKFLS